MALINTEQNVSVEILKTNEEKNMRNTFLKTIGGTMLTILMLAAFTNIPVSAQEVLNNPQTEDGRFQSPGHPRD